MSTAAVESVVFSLLISVILLKKEFFLNGRNIEHFGFILEEAKHDTFHLIVLDVLPVPVFTVFTQPFAY